MIRFAKIIRSAVLNGLALGLLGLPAAAATPVAMPANLPLYFETGQGPANATAQFIARGHDYQFLISATGVQIALCKADAESTAMQMQFVGANPQAQIHGDAELPGKVNYLTGNDPAHWRTGVGMFARVRIGELYPGINLIYYGNQRQLEYDFAIAPGTDPDVIAIHFDGTDKISVNPGGELILALAGGEIRQPKPVIYQLMNGVRKEIAGGYRLVDAHTVAFVVGMYDRSQPLVIDPVLGFSTYFGGTAGDTAWAVALDTNGLIYVTGETFSPKSYTNGWALGPAFSTFGAFQTNYNGGKYAGDAFVAKLGNDGTTIYYLTYLGGNGDNAAYSIAVDNAGNAYVVGYTDSTNFPTTNAIAIPGYNGTKISGVFDPNVKLYPSDAFVAELDASGSNLVYSTYLGGAGADAAYGVAVDSAGHAFVTGFTFSTNFPSTANARFKKLQCTNSFYFNCNAFVTEVASNGGALVYSSYFGGTNYDIGKGIAVATNGSVYVTGFTASTNFPATNYVQQVIGGKKFDGHLLNGSTNKNTASDAFIARFDSIGTNLVLVYSTFLGSTNNDMANGIAVDNNGAAYVTGWTVSTNFPNTVMNIAALHSFMATNTSLGVLATNVFLTKITYGTNAVIAWSAVFGGKGADIGNGVALDPAGNVFVTGSASSTNFPTYNVPGLMSATNSSKIKSGKSDAFVIAFTNTTGTIAGTNLIYSGYLGGYDNDFGYAIAVDTNDNAYVVGQTLSTNFPTFNTVTSETSRNGTNDAFITQIILTVAPPTITTQPAGQTNEVGSTNTFFINGTALPPYFLQWQKDGTNLVNGTNLVDGGSIISGATNVTLTIRNAQTNDNGSYSVILMNYGGSVTSSNASLQITNVLPAIMEPTNQLVGVGTTAILAVTVTNGTPPFSYQWQVGGVYLVNGRTNGATISGATSNVLTISNVQLTNSATNYTVIVKNSAGSVTSSNAILSVQASPVIVLQPTPTNQAIAVGSNATFTVTAVGTVPLHYQWWDGTNLVKNGGQISGATTNVLIIGNAQTNNSGSYTVIVTNSAGSVTSSNAILTVTNILPAIGTQPISQTNGVGTTVILAVTVTNGTPPLSYQWWINGTNLVKNGGHFSGATSGVLTISTVQLTNSGNYTVIVTNPGGSVTSSNAVLTVLSSPVIFVQPATNQSMAVKSTATFAVTAIGTVPLSYQWWVNGTNLVKNGTVKNGPTISGATTNVLIISNAQTTNSGNYTVIVTNIAGSVTSSNAILTVTNVPPSVTGPTNQTVAVGTTVTLAVTVTNGTVPLSYQWWVNGTNLVKNGGQIGGATTSMLTISQTQTTNSGNYTVIVTNFGGSVTSSVAILTVASSPVIVTQPSNQTVAVGATVTNVVFAVGTAPLRFQWWVDGTNLVKNGGGISGATNSVLTISNAQTNNSGNYTVTVTNSAGSVTSSNAVLTVALSPAIVVQPTNQTVAVGATTVTFAITATGTEPLSYQWQDGTNNLVDGGQINGAISNVLTISNAQTNNSGIYTVTITNLVGSVTSSNAVLVVVSPPAITAQPTNQTVEAGATTVTFAVTATGTEPLSYQWQDGTNNLVDGGQINGAISNVLTISNVQLTNNGIYTVTVTNLAGSVTSSNAVLTVTESPVITMQPTPTNQSLAVGATATIAVTAVGLEPLSYQWQINGTNLVDGTNLVNGDITIGSTTNVLTISNAQTNDSGSYAVIVMNLDGSVTSSNALLTVTNVPPEIGTQPTSQTVWVGSTATFIVYGTANDVYGPYFFQWLKDGTNLTDGTTISGSAISGSTNYALTISNAQTNDSGNYWLIITNPGGSVTSSNAVLTVLPPLSFGNILAATGGSFILSGTGGVSNGAYYVLISSNLLTPLTNWTYIATNQFDGQGSFIFTNTAQTNAPQLFYLLQLP
jgi:hypothetical protein